MKVRLPVVILRPCRTHWRVGNLTAGSHSSTSIALQLGLDLKQFVLDCDDKTIYLVLEKALGVCTLDRIQGCLEL